MLKSSAAHPALHLASPEDLFLTGFVPLRVGVDLVLMTTLK